MKPYRDYILEKARTPEYDLFLICLSHESILKYLESIEEEALIAGQSGKLLIDQLTVTGDGNNRYISCDYHDGKIDLSSGHIVDPDDAYRDHAVGSLKEHVHLLGNSILSDEQLEKIHKGERL